MGIQTQSRNALHFDAGCYNRGFCLAQGGVYVCQAMTPDLQRIQLAAALVGVSRSTLDRGIRLGLLKRIKNGPKMTFLSMANVQEWIKNGGNAGKVE